MFGSHRPVDMIPFVVQTSRSIRTQGRRIFLSQSKCDVRQVRADATLGTYSHFSIDLGVVIRVVVPGTERPDTESVELYAIVDNGILPQDFISHFPALFDNFGISWV